MSRHPVPGVIMRRLRYSVASSLDGFIAGPNGEFDWIPMDPDIDFGALFSRYDTLLMGRSTYEASSSYPGGMSMWKHMRIIVCSTTLTSVNGAELWSDNIPERVRALKEEAGKDLWLFGGGDLFRSLLEAGVVDDVEVAIVPVLVGGGIPIRALPASLKKLTLTEHVFYEKTGTVLMTYSTSVPVTVKKRRKT
jgi:dihydrofolate reductase